MTVVVVVVLISSVDVCVQCVDYSDDELERRAKAKLRRRRTGKVDDGGDVADGDSGSDDDESPGQLTRCQRQKQYVTFSIFICTQKLAIATNWPFASIILMELLCS